MTVITLPPTVVAPGTEPVTTSGTQAASAAAPEPAPAPPEREQAVSEADLLAYVPVPAMAAAEARAEWFVTDYFSTTDSQREQKLEGAYAGDTLPPPPAGGRAYVDWVRALTAELKPDQTVVVTVLYRLLVTDGADFATGPVQAVAVEVAVGPDGGTIVTALPRPVPLPAPPPGPPPMGAGGEPGDPPPELATAALGEIGLTVVDPVIVRAVPVGLEWRFWIEATDAAGLRWVYEVTASGPLDPTGGG